MVCKLKADFSFYLWHSILVSLTIFSSPVREALNVKENMTGLDYCTLGLKRIKDARKKLDGLRQKMGGYKTTQVLKKTKQNGTTTPITLKIAKCPSGIFDLWKNKWALIQSNAILQLHTHTHKLHNYNCPLVYGYRLGSNHGRRL